MTDPSPPAALAAPDAPTPPPMALELLTLLLRHGLTTLGGVLVARGVLGQADAAQFVVLVTGLAAGVAGVLWSIGQKYAARINLAAAINCQPPAVPVKP